MTQRDLQTHVDEFYDQGYTVFEQVLSPEEVGQLRRGLERAFSEPEEGPGASEIVRTRMFRHGEAFEDLVDRAPVADFADAVLGERCQLIAMNAIKTPPGTGISSWHADEELQFVLPDGAEWPEEIRLPVYWFNCMYYLVDVTQEMGPTEVVPGSHRSGRQPGTGESPPSFRGEGPVSILAQAGDCLVFNSQTWHRGAKNESAGDTRLVQGVTYGRFWTALKRFYWPGDVPPAARARAGERRARIYGLHELG